VLPAITHVSFPLSNTFSAVSRVHLTDWKLVHRSCHGTWVRLEFDLSHSSICQKECQLLEFVYYASLCNAHNSTLGCVQFAFRRLLKLDCLCLSDLILFLSLGCRRLISRGKTFGYSRFRYSAGLYLQENAFRSVRYHIRPGMWEKSLLMFSPVHRSIIVYSGEQS